MWPWLRRRPQNLPELRSSRVAGRVVVPRHVVTATHVAFLPYWQAGVETAAFWAGPDSEERGVITTLVQPSLHQTPGNYHVPPAARMQMARRLGAQGLVVYAQVHTHPRAWVGHSAYDDAHAYSTADGSLSLVWPEYGRACPHDLEGIGLHVRLGGRWTELVSQEERDAHLHLVDDHLDLRFSIQAGGLHDDE